MKKVINKYFTYEYMGEIASVAAALAIIGVMFWGIISYY